MQQFRCDTARNGRLCWESNANPSWLFAFNPLLIFDISFYITKCICCILPLLFYSYVVNPCLWIYFSMFHLCTFSSISFVCSIETLVDAGLLSGHTAQHNSTNCISQCNISPCVSDVTEIQNLENVKQNTIFTDAQNIYTKYLGTAKLALICSIFHRNRHKNLMIISFCWDWAVRTQNDFFLTLSVDFWPVCINISSVFLFKQRHN